MPDLDQRLRDDAARTDSIGDPVPDFGDALTAAVSRSSGRSRWPLAAAAGAAAAVLAVGGSVAPLWHSSAPTTGARHGPGITATDGGSARPLGAIVQPESAVPRRLLVIARNRVPGCTSPRARVRETPSRIRVWVREIVPAVATSPSFAAPATDLPSDGSLLGRPGKIICSNASYSQVSIHLDRPVGNRMIVDGMSGRAVPLLTGPAPTPSYVPFGYHLADRTSDDPRAINPLDGRLGAFFPVSVSRSYVNDAGDYLQVVSAVAGSKLYVPRVVGHVSVNGHQADQTVSNRVRCVNWRLAGDNRRQVCSLTGDRTTTLSFAQLRRVARSLTD